MSGMVGVIAQDAGRYSLFAVSLTVLRSPPNTALRWKLTSDRIIGRNSHVETALETGAEWLMFIDDDHTFGPDLLVRLLAHDLPVVGALYMQRQRPFAPIAYSAKEDDGTYRNLDLTAYGEDAVVEVAALGTGGMLIRAEVLRAMPFPWFEHGLASEDLIFCDKARKLGFPVHVDLAARMGHLSPSAVWPTWHAGGWSVGFAVADEFALSVPIQPPE